MWEKINPHTFLHYNTFSDSFMLLNKEKHELYENTPCNELEGQDLALFKKLVENHFIIPDSFNEYDMTSYVKQQMLFDSTTYQVVINTTLDCNLNCWYCYENRIPGSRLSKEVIESIKKNILLEYQQRPFKNLIMSFFGGEPFLDFKAIKELLSFAKDFTGEKKLHLTADFTTNATLITPQHIDFLKDYECHFQITLDGDREVHNTIKKDKVNHIDTYQKTLDVLHLIDAHIPNHWLAVRINFDNRTLAKIDEIIANLAFLDRKKCFVILKKVWQIETQKVNTPLLHTAIQKFFDNNFLLDYYIMPKGCVCFAQRLRQALFSYDGKIFKCTTISSFGDENALGNLNMETGEIEWDTNKISQWMKDAQPEQCRLCKWYPACLGICNRQLIAHPNENMCTFDAMNLTQKEYLMYSFKFHLLKKQLGHIK